MDDNTDLIPLRPEEEAPPTFDLVRRGYDRHQVDGHLAWLEERLRETESLRSAAEHAAARAAAEAAGARDELEQNRPDWASFGERIGSILRLAEDEAAELRQRGARDAEHLAADARRMAEDADRAHSRRVQEAEREAQETVRSAQIEGERIVREAQQIAAREERDSRRQLADIERQRDAVHRQLMKLQEGLSAAMAPLRMEAGGDHVELDQEPRLQQVEA